MSDKVFYITTPIYYVNDLPHVGNASTTIAADVIARFKRLEGRRVLFATGTDENAIKVAEAAQMQKMMPKEFVDGIVPRWTDAWHQMHISYDVFIRTTEEQHQRVVESVFRKLLAQGDIYRDAYTGWYCVSDETFFRESEVIDRLCPNPECRKPVRWVEEESYFFRLSAYQERLLKYIEANPDFLAPGFRRNEVLSFIKAGLKDACITRKAYGWGIPVPDEPSQVIYVWFDALLNYLTVAGYGADDKQFTEVWPADFQLVGKDIFVRFHSTLWPAMLMALGVDQPRQIFAHGFWTIEGEKMSKSKGNAISPVKLAQDLANMSGAEVDIAVDAIRYFILREIPFGLDGDFSTAGLVSRFNADLANDLGNLLNRTLPLLHNHREGVVPKPHEEDTDTSEIRERITKATKMVTEHLNALRFSEALETIWSIIGRTNKYMEEQAPWRLAKESGKEKQLDTVLYTVLDTVRSVAIMLQPFMPTVATAIWKQLGIPEPLDSQRWSDASIVCSLKPGTKTLFPKPIFPRVDSKQKISGGNKKDKASQASEEKTMTEISFEDFKKLDLRIGKISVADRVPGTDKLLQLKVDIGSEERQMVAGIAGWYTPEDLVGKEVVVIVNLAPATIRGVESRGMILAADVNGTAVLLSPDKEVPPGSAVR